MHRNSRFLRIQTWAGLILLMAAGVYFYTQLLPQWQPKLEEFWEASAPNAGKPMLFLSVFLMAAGYYFSPLPGRKYWRR